MQKEWGDPTPYPDNWEERAAPLLKNRSLKEEEFAQKVFLDWLCPAALRAAFDVYSDLPQNKGRTQVALAEELGISKATYYRARGQINTRGFALMGVLVNLVGAIPAIDKTTLFFRIACEVLKQIQEEVFCRNPHCLTPIEFAAVHYFMLSEVSVKFDKEENLEAVDLEEMYAAMTDVWRELEARYPTEDLRVDNLVQTIFEWRHAYLLFRQATDRWDFQYDE